ncbi:DUF697 domain-containing protein [Promicromonospora sp. CA-289599]|uniref:DUF697 domain-containing protein n=1 Tax=Promicromonospora sp. CA-289599 TaxID=3240014 RepID=UPI003D8FF068
MVTTASKSGKILNPDELLEAARAERARIGRFNLAVVGGTGVGKSSLVNAIFGEDLAPTGIGLPVTRGIDYYTNPDGSLGIWDFEGFEVGSSRSPAEVVRDNLETIANGPNGQRIAAVWYCIASTAARLQPAEIAVISEFKDQGLPVVIVLTKVARIRTRLTREWIVSDDAQRMREWLEKPTTPEGTRLHLRADAVALTAAVDQGKFGGPAHGLDELITITLDLSPDDQDEAIKVAQKISLPLKRELCRRAINTAVAAAAAAALVPIPIADAVALAGIQLAMMGKICTYYGIDLAILGGGQLMTQLGLQFAGKALARSLLKLIPGAGMAINAGVAAGLTAATGEAWMRFCEAIYSGKIDLENIENAWKDYAPTFAQVIAAVQRHRMQN